MPLFRTLLFSLVTVSCTSYLNDNQIPKFVPQGYHLDLYPDVNTGFLKGLVSINIATYAEPSNVIELDADPTIVIHYKSIKVSEIPKDVRHETNGTKVVYEVKAVERVLFDLGTLKIHLTQKLQRDITYQVRITFETLLKNDSNNQPFYMRTFFDSDTHVERKFVIMDLTKTGCYKAFPCFNKVEYKCWVSLAVIRQPNFYALSTAPVNYTTNVVSDGSLVKDFFLNTPPMSMNSLALVVSDYRLINALSLKGGEASDMSDETKIGRSREVAPVVKMILKRVEERLGIPFPLPSFHVIMVPKYANIPYVNAFGLLVVNISSSDDEYILIEDLAFGACYQWFVHVASPALENSTAYTAIAHLKNIIADEVIENVEINPLSKFDYSQLIFMKLVRTPTEKLLLSNRSTSKKFEKLAFSLLDRIYPNLINEAMHKLLRKKEFRMYTDADFWTSLNDIVNKQQNGYKENFRTPNLHQVLDSWKKVRFVTLITVTRNYGSDEINITREPFIYSNYKYNIKKIQENLPRYPAPILPIVISQPSNFVSNNQLVGWMSNDNGSHATFELGPRINPVDIIVINPGHLGPFVVNYDEKNWRMLTENFRSLPSDIQLQLLVDSLVLADTGLLDYSVFLNMSKEIPIDEQHLPLLIQYSTLVEQTMEKFHGKLAEKYKEFISRQKAILFSRISVGKLEKYSLRIRKTVNDMKHLLNCLTDQSTCFTPLEYENLVYEARAGKRLTGKHNCEVIKNVSLFDWQVIANGLFHALQNSSSSDRSHILHVLSCTELTLAFETYMNLLLLNFNKSSLLLTKEDQKYVLAHMDYRHLRALKYFTDKNFEALKERLSHDSWVALMDSIIKSTRSEEDLQELLEFSEKHAGDFDDAIKRIIQEGIVMVSTEVMWKSEVFPLLEQVLDHILKNFDDAVDDHFKEQSLRNYYYA